MRTKRSIWTGGTVLLVIAVVAWGAAAQAQSSPDHSGWSTRPELAFEYSYLRSNAPPGGCGCFNLNGGSAEFAWPTAIRGVALVGNVTASHANNIGSSNTSLTLSSFTGGARYSPALKPSRYQPFGQVLVGLAHASGSLVQGQAASSSNAFAASLGGGLDLPINHRVSLRLFEADYLVTTFGNGINNRQNLLHVSTGLVFHF